MSFQSLFYPRGVAVVGSVSEGKIGYELVRQILDGGYEAVFAVNPKAGGLPSVPGYETIGTIDHPVDLAIIVSPPPTVASVLEDCGRAGVRAAVVITAGFSEVGNVTAEQEIKRAADLHGIRFVGPNCAGLVNTAHRLFPTLETRPPAGGVSIIAQSGAIGGVFLAWAKEFGLGIAKFVSYGNGADLNEVDLLRYLATDPETEVIGLYIESVADGREFMQALRACTAHKPVVAIKAGRTQSGRRATLSHTGSLAGADAVYDAALRQCGAIRVHTIEDMFDLCKAFAYLPPLQGRRVGIVTNSGGPGVLAADRAEEVGLDVAEPSPELKQILSGFLPAHCALKNPIDLTVEGTEDGYRRTLLAVLQEVDVTLSLNVATPYIDSVPLARGTCDAAAQSGKPIAAAFLPTQIVSKGIAHLQKRSIPNFATGERAVAALARMADYEESRKRDLGLGFESHELEAAEQAPEPFRKLPGEGPILEPEAMAWLRENSIPVPEFRFARTPAQVAQGGQDIGYPIAIKVVSPDILHKSDVGGVILDVQDEHAALAAFETLRASTRAASQDFRGVIIYPMVQGAQEVLVGLSRDPQFGPVVAFGLGGIYTESWRDVSLRIAPVNRAEAEAMIREIRAIHLLEGVRGQPPCDLESLAEVLVTVSWLPFRYPKIDEVDLNPVFLFSKGLLVGDVRVIRRA
jgi:acyl-CoA synthetase (NDP forming)